MRNTSVSVIIPTYNRARYLAECIDSVLAQTFSPTEILLIDDGSTDHTRDVVSTYKDPRIHYLATPHGGVAAARNKGLAIASCEYLAFLDSDDLWRETMLERQLEMLTEDDGLMCCFSNFARIMDNPRRVINEQFTFCSEFAHLEQRLRSLKSGFVLDGDAFSTFVQFHEFPAYLQCMVFRRAIISDMRMDESLRIGEDTEFIMRAFMRGKVAVLPEVLADIRRHNSNITNESGILIEQDKVRALLQLRAVVDTGDRLAALNDRLVKGHIDSATALIRTGRRMEGMLSYMNALKTPGSPKRKLKGLARTTFDMLSSARGGRSNRTS